MFLVELGEARLGRGRASALAQAAPAATVALALIPGCAPGLVARALALAVAVAGIIALTCAGLFLCFVLVVRSTTVEAGRKWCQGKEKVSGTNGMDLSASLFCQSGSLFAPRFVQQGVRFWSPFAGPRLGTVGTFLQAIAADDRL